MADLVTQINALVAKVPVAQQPAATALLTQWGPKFFLIAQEDAWNLLRRLLAGDLDVVTELDSTLSNDEFVSRVKANTARWDGVANYNKVRSDLANEFLLRVAPIVGAILAALVGL